MGFIRQQEENMALRLLAWHHKKNHMPLPGPSDLRQQAARLVDDAHRIARERGQNVLSIIKDMAGDLKSKSGK